MSATEERLRKINRQLMDSLSLAADQIVEYARAESLNEASKKREYIKTLIKNYKAKGL